MKDYERIEQLEKDMALLIQQTKLNNQRCLDVLNNSEGAFKQFTEAMKMNETLLKQNDRFVKILLDLSKEQMKIKAILRNLMGGGSCVTVPKSPTKHSEVST